MVSGFDTSPGQFLPTPTPESITWSLNDLATGPRAEARRKSATRTLI